MPEPTTSAMVERVLRAALGGDGQSDQYHGAARERVVSQLRHRQARRLQRIGGVAVVLVALAVALPQVLGGSSPKSRAPEASPRAAPSLSALPPAPRCMVGTVFRSPCGEVAQKSDGNPKAAAGVFDSATSAGAPLTIPIGERVVVTLPRDGHWRVHVVRSAGASSSFSPSVSSAGRVEVLSAGGGSSPGSGSGRRFVLVGEDAGAVVVEARAQGAKQAGTAGQRAGTPATATPSGTTWRLDVNVRPK